MEESIKLEHRLTAVEKQCGSNRHRIEDLEENQAALMKLATSVEVMATEQGRMKDDIGEIKKDVKAITSKSGKRWDGIVDKIILTVVAALVTYIMVRIGLK